MSLEANIAVNCYSILLVVILAFYSRNLEVLHPRQRKLYCALLFLVAFMLFWDILSRLDGTAHFSYPMLSRISNFIMFTVNPCVPSLWYAYVYCQVHGGRRVPRRTVWVLVAMNVINFALVIASQFTGWYYWITPDNYYHRGPFYPLSTIPALALLSFSYISIFKNRAQVEARVFKALILFPIMPIAGIIVQAFVYGYQLGLNTIVPAMLVLLFNVQNDGMTTDYLTGAGNRKKLQTILTRKIARCAEGRTFALIMLDIDHFKIINDTLGHEMGDVVLRNAADLLKRSVRISDVVVRYGGDEFCLIVDSATPRELDRIVNRIHTAQDTFNRENKEPYELSFSIGSAIYDPEKHASADELLRTVDLLMFQNKREKGAARPCDQPETLLKTPQK